MKRKTIQEAAKSYAIDKSLIGYASSYNGFVAGVEFAIEWIPLTKENQPEIGSEVLVVLDYTSYGRGKRVLLARVNWAEVEISYGGPNSLTGSGRLKGLYFSLPSIVKPGIVTHYFELPPLPKE